METGGYSGCIVYDLNSHDTHDTDLALWSHIHQYEKMLPLSNITDIAA